MATLKLIKFLLPRPIIYSLQNNIMTTNSAKAKKLLESLKDNPYFDKYAASISRLQQTNPEEFISRVEAKDKKQKHGSVDSKYRETAAAAAFDEKPMNPKPTLSSGTRGINPSKLSDVMKLELLEDKSKQDITGIWLEYHKKKDCICGVMEPKIFDIMFENGAKYPMFILPLPRKNGYEFILSQFFATEVHMTPLLYYQTHHENAPECLKIVHYTDLRESKNIILMKGEFDTNMLSVQEAQCLANELQLYYAQNNNERSKLLKIFTNTPDEFKHMDLISQLESINLTSTNIFTYTYSPSEQLWGLRNNQWHSTSKKSWIRQLHLREYGKYESKSIYITTPIFYVNAGPHIGHLYTAALADTLARYHKMLGHEVFLNTGTDEHGNKVRNAASVNNLSPEQYSEHISGMFKQMADTFHVGYDNFIRTTESRHYEAVQQFWTRLQNAGHIYLGKYSGWYCPSDEAFVDESELQDVKDSAGNVIKVSTSGNHVEWMEEDNYKFRLSHFQNDLRYWLKDSTVVQPMKYHQILSAWIEEGWCLEDLSISRPTSRAPWGIKVPDDNSHTIYVWLDALVNYLTSVGYPNDQFSKLWPPTIQIIGKDILKFHGVYWPAFLIAAGLDPPTSLLCHSHWTVCDEKMSKSKGNVVSPHEAAKIFTADGLRYFLLREAVPHNDANYSNDKIRNILNTELANTLGNLVNRCMGKAVNLRGIIPEPTANAVDILNTDEAHKLVENLENLSITAENAYNECNLHRVVDAVMQTLFSANKMIECQKPWALAKEIDPSGEAQLKLDAVLALGLEATRICSIILLPIVPRLFSNLLDSLNVPSSSRMWSNCKYLNTGRRSTDIFELKRDNGIFFKRIKSNS